MNKKTIRIAGAQKSFPVGAIQKNKQTILDCFEAAEEKEADILIFPELALTGYPPEDLLLRESFVGKNFAVLEELAEFSSSTSGVVGFVDRNLDDNNTDKVYPEVDDVPDNIKKEWLYDYSHDSEGC